MGSGCGAGGVMDFSAVPKNLTFESFLPSSIAWMPLHSMQVGPARFRAPELLFRPDLIGEECEGIHEVR